MRTNENLNSLAAYAVLVMDELQIVGTELMKRKQPEAFYKVKAIQEQALEYELQLVTKVLNEECIVLGHKPFSDKAKLYQFCAQLSQSIN